MRSVAQRLLALLVAVTAPVLSACTMLPQVCVPPAENMVTAELTFGRKVGDRVGVSEAEFSTFVAREISPRFPDGLTIVDARGQWRDAERGVVVHEPSKLVLLTFRDDIERRASITAITETYKRQFKQQSVLMSLRTSCVAF
ncbi:DUF3574 domain-containing protein [Bradyrhizobium sp. LHD-71]|uniref:DUF3574 domain-containing protein n=1 Tax=Bradyrhizobium sp. LHD-71 TaxID=3072141 RepID=UPI0028103075|nr:DUF3574 domain-containing protein [Bradyrhizobium sp. LHD-71]MDQ8726555.1 DUF3574 domain-containing protein [Bradyrhizobium sp. LHD-71]